MFLESFSGKGRKEIESQFEQLNSQLEDKQIELDNKERHIESLSKNIRKWTRRYHELELSISETEVEEADAAKMEHDEETKQLRDMLLKLNRKNDELEKRIEKLQNISQEIALTEKSSSKSDDDNSFDRDRIVEPEFSTEIQNQFQEYASKCG